jgi:hypothetical protein
MTKKIILMDYVFHITKNAIYVTSIDNYRIARKYNYSKKIKKIVDTKIHSVLSRECTKIMEKIQKIVNMTKYIQI